MSTGSIIGAVIGGVIGFFMGGPMGAIYGAGMGFSLGMMLDPINPDRPTAGSPNIDEVVMTSQIGVPVKDLLGTGLITGHLLCYGKERVVEITETADGGGKGGGSSQTYVTGYEYYMTYAVGICKGPVDVLYSVFKGEDLVWDGVLELPASGGKETIVLDGMGDCTFYFGTDDQAVNSIVGELIPDDTLNTPWRNFCWALLDDCVIGKYSARTPTLRFMVGKHPVLDFSDKHIIQEYDYNPIHAIWYILNNLCGLPEEWLDESKFSQAATSIFLEFKGISILFSTNQSALSYLTAINTHIDNVLNFTNEGKFATKLFRDDYNEDTAPLIDENILLEAPNFKRDSWITTKNEIKIQYNELINVERKRIVSGRLYWGGSNNGNVISDTGGSSPSDWIDPIPDIADWKVQDVSVRIGTLHIQKLDGSVWGRGQNQYGEVGKGSVDASPYYSSWSEIPGGPWKKVIPCKYMTIMLNLYDQLFVCGRNNVNGEDFLNIGSKHTTNPTLKQDLAGVAWSKVMFYDHKMGVANTVWPYPVTTVPGVGASNFGGMGTNYYHNMGFSSPKSYYFDPWHALTLSGAGIVDIQMGNQFTHVAIGEDENFELMSCGHNSNYGSCGVGNFDQYTQVFTEVLGGPWKYYSVGTSHTIAIKADGTLWGCGNNYNGELGQGDTTHRNSMTQMGTSSNWVKCVATSRNTYAINSLGELWTCGYHLYVARSWYGGAEDVHYTELGQEQTYGTWLNVWGYTSGLIAMK